MQRSDSPTAARTRDLLGILMDPKLLPIHAEAARALAHPEELSGVELGLRIAVGPAREARA
jgi:hypothetical protein